MGAKVVGSTISSQANFLTIHRGALQASARIWEWSARKGLWAPGHECE